MTVKKFRIFRQFIRKVLLESLDDAQILSQYAHRGQKRRTGKPYSLHPQEVADIIKSFYPNDNAAYYAALFHDTIEDAIPLGNIEDEEELYAFIYDVVDDASIVDDVFNAVRLLTKSPNSDYLSYMNTEIDEPTALRVKIADMIQNLSDFPSDKQKRKYTDAFHYINNKTNGKPSVISGPHWNAFKELVESDDS